MGSRTPLGVMHVHSGAMFGGVERVIVALARRTDLAPGIAWRWALTVPGRLSEELSAAGAAPAVIGRARASRPWSVRAAQAQLRLLLRREPADLAIVHSLWSLALFGRTIAREGTGIVLWVHGVAETPWWQLAWARRTAPRHVIANSRFTAAHLPAFLSGLPLDVVYPPLAWRAAPAGSRAAVRAKLAGGAAADEVVMVQVARLEETKGHRVLIEAAAGLPGRWRLWIAGGAVRSHERRYERQLRALVRRLGLEGRVAFLGEQTDIPGLLAAADVYVQPNTAPEAFGLALVEALLAARPVVASASGAATELVGADTAMLVPPGDAAALRAALAGLLADPARRRTLGDAGPAAAAGLTDPDVMIPRLAGVLLRAAS